MYFVPTLLKDRDPKELQTNVVYRFNCLSDSNVHYIGYMNRTLKEHVKEDLAGGTRISDHIGICQTCSKNLITPQDFAILKKCRRKHDTAVFEALFIKRFNPSLNKQLIKPGYSHQLQIFIDCFVYLIIYRLSVFLAFLPRGSIFRIGE